MTDYDLAVQRLVSWFKTNGGELSPDVEIVYSNSSGYHCRARKNLESPVVANCPLSLTLSYLNLDHAQSLVPHVESPLTKCLGRVPDHVLTYLLLVEQRQHPDKERLKWFPYMACLPEPGAMATPLWFDREQMKHLVGTNLARETSVKLEKLTREWNHAREVLETVDAIDTAMFSLHWFQWAATIVSSRAFISTHVLPDKATFPILFPVVDIPNHSPTARVEWDFHPRQDFTLKLLDHDNILPGSEIFNNYAPKQNDELLLGYGFCIPDNPVEQFALKMQLPPGIEQAARNMNMFEPKNVPFQMDTQFLTSASEGEPLYLRSKGHPFGRYENRLPFLRGLPPSVVHMFYVKALVNLGLHPEDVDVKSLPPRLVFETLLLAYEAIDRRSQSLPLIPARRDAFSDEREKYATIYRDGQAKILHAIRGELKDVIDGLRCHGDVPSRPVIISTTEALAHLSAEFSDYASHFRNGLEQQYETKLSTWDQYSADISTLQVGQQPAELSVWKLLLCLYLVLYQKDDAKKTLGNGGVRHVIFGWIEYLLVQYPIINVSADVDAEAVQDFILGYKDHVKEVGKAYAWADEVADRYAFPLIEEVENEEVQRICMYLQVLDGKEENGSWMYDEPAK